MQNLVINLNTGEQQAYDTKLKPKQALICCYYQQGLNNFNTWEYDYEKHDIQEGQYTLALNLPNGQTLSVLKEEVFPNKP